MDWPLQTCGAGACPDELIEDSINETIGHCQPRAPGLKESFASETKKQCTLRKLIIVPRRLTYRPPPSPRPPKLSRNSLQKLLDSSWAAAFRGSRRGGTVS